MHLCLTLKILWPGLCYPWRKLFGRCNTGVGLRHVVSAHLSAPWPCFRRDEWLEMALRMVSIADAPWFCIVAHRTASLWHLVLNLYQLIVKSLVDHSIWSSLDAFSALSTLINDELRLLGCIICGPRCWWSPVKRWRNQAMTSPMTFILFREWLHSCA